MSGWKKRRVPAKEALIGQGFFGIAHGVELHLDDTMVHGCTEVRAAPEGLFAGIVDLAL